MHIFINIYNMFTQFENNPFKIVGEVDYTNSIPKSKVNRETDGLTDIVNLNAPLTIVTGV